MVMAAALDQLESATERLGKRRCIMPYDRQATTPLRAIDRKRADNDVPAGSHRSQDPLGIGGAIFGLRQEMEGGSVVPDVKGLGRFPLRHVSNEPAHL